MVGSSPQEQLILVQPIADIAPEPSHELIQRATDFVGTQLNKRSGIFSVARHQKGFRFQFTDAVGPKPVFYN